MAVPTDIRWERLTDEGYIRYYEARVVNDLLGDWTIVKSWGRRGCPLGGMEIVPVDDQDQALIKMRALAAHRRKHHYEVVRCDGDIEIFFPSKAAVAQQAVVVPAAKSPMASGLSNRIAARRGRRSSPPRMKETPASQGFSESVRRV